MLRGCTPGAISRLVARGSLRSWCASLADLVRAGYSEAKANLAAFIYAKAFALALRRTWAEAKAGRSSRRVDPAEYASSFNTWAAERGRALVYLSA